MMRDELIVILSRYDNDMITLDIGGVRPCQGLGTIESGVRPDRDDVS
jgi:hypothetical protein